MSETKNVNQRKESRSDTGTSKTKQHDEKKDRPVQSDNVEKTDSNQNKSSVDWMNVRVHTVPLYKRYIAPILDGRKQREGRIMSGMFRNIQQGEVMKFSSNGTPSIFAHVVKRVIYPTFREMLAAEGVPMFLPDQPNISVDQAVGVYHSFPRYREKEERHGVVSFHIDVNIPQDESKYAQQQQVRPVSYVRRNQPNRSSASNHNRSRKRRAPNRDYADDRGDYKRSRLDDRGDYKRSRIEERDDAYAYGSRYYSNRHYEEDYDRIRHDTYDQYSQEYTNRRIPYYDDRSY